MGFEPTIPASERPQTSALDRMATGIAIEYTIIFLCLTKSCYVIWKNRDNSRKLKQDVIYTLNRRAA